MAYFTSKRVQSLFRLTRGKINHYVVAGLISNVDEKVGTGRERQFSRINLLEFAIVQKLIEQAYHHEEIKEVLIFLREEYAPMRSEESWQGLPEKNILAIVNRRYASLLQEEEVSLDRLLRRNSRRQRPFESVLLINLSLELALVMKTE